MTTALPKPFLEPRDEDRAAEQRAELCIERCCSAQGLKAVPLPIPVEEWIERPLGIDYGFEQIANRGDRRILGYANLAANRIRINADIAHDDHRVRWTAAHELGHIELHTPIQHVWTEQHDTDPDWTHRYRNPYERQADRFAGAFLMPSRSLVAELFRLCAQGSLRPETTIPELVTGSEESLTLWRDLFLPGLCATFGVSTFGAVYRLADLRLFDGAPVLLQRHVYRLVQ